MPLRQGSQPVRAAGPFVPNLAFLHGPDRERLVFTLFVGMSLSRP